MKLPYQFLLLGFLSSVTTHAAGVIATVSTQDAVAQDSNPRDGTGDTVGDVSATTLRAGLAGTTGSTTAQSVILVFELPTLTAFQQINTTTGSENKLTFRFDGYRSGSSSNLGSLDLYGLAFRSSSTVLASDYFNGALDSAAGVSLIQNDIVAASNASSGTKQTDAAADTALGTFLAAQYSNGAVGGDFVFFRLNFDGPTTPNEANGFTISSANNGTSGNRPTLTVDVIPEPSTALLGALGVLALLRRRR